MRHQKDIYTYANEVIDYWDIDDNLLATFVLKEGLIISNPSTRKAMRLQEVQELIKKKSTKGIRSLLFYRPDLEKFQDNKQHLKSIDDSLFLYKEDCNWFKGPGLEKPLIKRVEDTERAVWDKFIKPIVKEYNMDFSYEFMPVPGIYLNEFDIYLMDRKIMDACNVFETNDFIKEVLRPLKYKTTRTTDDDRDINLLLLFANFLSELFKINIKGLGLPHFLEWLKEETNYNPCPQETDKKDIDPSRKELIEKYAKIATNFSQQFKDRGEQVPSRHDVEDHLSKYLKNADEKIGTFVRLPERMFRKVWEKVPTTLKRERGVITKHKN